MEVSPVRAPFSIGAHVLGAEGDAQTLGLQHRTHGAQINEGWRDHHVGVFERSILDQHADLLDEVQTLDEVEVHLPVADDQGAFDVGH